MSDRPSEIDVLMQVAWAWSQRATCSRLSVGALIVQDGRILSHGYNGAPVGMPHCDHSSKEIGFGLESSGGCTTAVHAEANAIYYAARRGRSTDGAMLICTHQPCKKCAEAIINAGITHVLYQEPYRDESGLLLLSEAGVQVGQYELET